MLSGHPLLGIVFGGVGQKRTAWLSESSRRHAESAQLDVPLEEPGTALRHAESSRRHNETFRSRSLAQPLRYSESSRR